MCSRIWGYCLLSPVRWRSCRCAPSAGSEESEMARYEHVIVGGGLAAGMAAQEYREAGGSGSVLLIGREPHPPYHRPPLTKEFLRGEKPVEELYMRSAAEWADMGVELRLSTEVTALDLGDRAVELPGGERVSYERLLLAD